MRARSGTTPAEPLSGADFTTVAAPPEMAPYLRDAHRLRRAEMRRLIHRCAAWLARLIPGSNRGTAGPGPTAAVTRDQDIQHQHSLRSALTVIRTTAELLRDNPDMPAHKRAHFARMMLEEEARLEEMLLRDKRAA